MPDEKLTRWSASVRLTEPVPCVAEPAGSTPTVAVPPMYEPPSLPLACHFAISAQPVVARARPMLAAITSFLFIVYSD